MAKKHRRKRRFIKCGDIKSVCFPIASISLVNVKLSTSETFAPDDTYRKLVNEWLV